MEPKIYLIAYNTLDEMETVESIRQYVVDSKDFVAYWNYIPLVYIVKSYKSLQELRDKFRNMLGKNQFMIAEISAAHIDGFLPKSAWDWFYHDHGQLSLAHMGLGSFDALSGVAEGLPKK